MSTGQRAMRLGVIAATVAGAGCVWIAPGIAVAAATGSPSAIGNELPASIAISPAYSRTGVVMVVASDAGGCQSNCGHLWLSRDRGDTWSQVATTSFSGSHIEMAVDGSGHEIVFAQAAGGLERSDDLGVTWKQVGGAGVETVSPGFAKDATVVVAGKPDYALHGGTSQSVAGSGGAMADAAWAIPAGYPTPGTRPAALLGGLTGATPTVEHCTPDFACAMPVPLPAPDSFAGAPNLFTSSAYSQDGVVFAQTADGLYKATDGGTTFSSLALPTAGATHVGIGMLALSPGYAEAGPDRRAYVAAMIITGSGRAMRGAGAIFATADGGSTWSSLGSPSPFDDGAMSVAVAPDGRVFGGYFGAYGAGLLCNPDGKAWRVSCDDPRSTVGAGSAPASRAAASAPPCSGTHCATPRAAATQGSPPLTGGTATPGSAASGSELAGAAQPPGQLSGSVSRLLLVAVLAALVGGAAGAALYLRGRRRTTR